MCKADQYLDDLPPLREVIKTYGLHAQKSLGQNFLLDQNITDKIVAKALSGVQDPRAMTVLEIGPGPGGLTRSLLKADVGRVLALELDPRAVRALEALQEHAENRLSVIHADALAADLTAFCAPPRMIVANLPYNIATPLLIGWLRQIRHSADAFSAMTLMFQKEVAQRITAQPGTKAYGRLSVISQWLCDVQIVYTLPPSAFTPPPKVDSSVVRFIPRALSGLQPSFDAVQRVTEAAFGQRRKMIRSSLKAYGDILDDLGIDTTRRAETLSVQDFINIAEASHND